MANSWGGSSAWGTVPPDPPTQAATPTRAPVSAPAPAPTPRNTQPRQAAPTQKDTDKRSDIIVKAAARGKFLDFRNALVPPLDKDYAMMHGCGGADHAPRSGIRLLLTDYSAGAGKSTVVSANVGPEFAPYVLSVCQRNVGEIPPQEKLNFSYKQERVNVYKKLDGGFVPVSTLVVQRQGVRKTGEVSQLPWSVQITNFEAKPNPQKNGTTSYVSSTARNKKEAFILMSDGDMFRCLYRVTRFLEMWELGCSLPIIRRAIAEKDAERAANFN